MAYLLKLTMVVTRSDQYYIVFNMCTLMYSNVLYTNIKGDIQDLCLSEVNNFLYRWHIGISKGLSLRPMLQLPCCQYFDITLWSLTQ